MSSGTVIFGLGYMFSTTVTPMPLDTAAATSSVMRAPLFLIPSYAERISEVLKTCGVCMAHRRDLSMSSSLHLRASAPSGILFMVSVTFAARTAAPSASAARPSFFTFSTPASGRAPSCMNTSPDLSEISRRPFKTLSCRSAPPRV